MTERSEKEKMIAGELYDPNDTLLISDRMKARQLLFQFNHTPPDALDERTSLLKKLFGSVKDAIYIEPSFQCDYGYNIHVGSNFYANFNCVFLDVNTIHIGDNVLVAPNVSLFTASHPIDVNIRLSLKEWSAPIRIGDNVWLGGGTIVCPGVTIGENSIIGAGSVVVKDIPANVVAVGNPCRIIKKL
ncbi:MAG: sugar O-acetyltransferase [Cytophagales bacterium]|nr:sugar O-acetyltransferase [Cytophaga sp.]